MRTWLVLLALWLCGLSSALAAPNLTASIEREVVTVGETVTFSLTFEDVSPSGTPNLPSIPNVQITGVSTSTEMNIMNGRRSTRQSYNYTLVPTQPGEVTIPAIQAQAQGRIFSTQPVKFRVVKANAPDATDPNGGKLAFLQLQIPKNELYIGEPLPVDIILYVVAANEVRMPQIEADGFTTGKMVQGGQTRTVRDGQIYSVLTIKTYVAPVRTGSLKLGPITMALAIPRPNTRRTIFGDVYDWQQVTLRAEPQTLNVLPLPQQNVPPDFTGVVGSYRMSVSAGPTDLSVGDPITLKVQIAGRGLLEGLSLPSQPWPDFKFYPASGKLESNDPLNLAGVKSFEQVVIPQNHEIKFLPSLRFSYFDTELRTYRTLTNAPIPLNVRATASAVAPVLTNATAGKNSPPPVDDIVHIKAHLEKVAMVRPPLLQRPWFLGFQAVPLLAWVSLLVLRKRSEALANNPRLRRQRQVDHRLREGLLELRAQAEARQTEQFFATLFRLLQERLGERLDMPASAITEAVIDERLQGHDLDTETLDQLRQLFRICDQFRYAPMKSKQELASFIPKLEKVLSQLQEWRGV